MSRSGFFLSVSGPAAILTLLVHPTIRQTADHWVPSRPSTIVVASDAVTIPAIGGVVQLASVPNIPSRAAPSMPSSRQTASEKDAPRMRKPLQEGCERSISSLAGPEARRMVAGRCMT